MGRVRALSRAGAAAQPQSAVRARAASMTDALLPAAPRPLEKKDDGYFRKVGGFGRAAGCGPWAAGALPPAPFPRL